MGRDGFEPSKTKSTDLQSVAFGRSAIFPWTNLFMQSNAIGCCLEPWTFDLQEIYLCLVLFASWLVPRAGIEPATQGFSVLCSTDWAIEAKFMATRKRLELSTSSVTGWRSNQLSYRAILNWGAFRLWWAFTDLNRGPTGYEPVALTNWAKGPKILESRWSDSNR